jgi:DNA-binding CsgD family transcriptional regulator
MRHRLPPSCYLLQMTLHELQQQMLQLAAISPEKGKVQVAFSLYRGAGRAALSFWLPDAPPGQGYLQGNIHIALTPSEAAQLFYWLLGHSTWEIKQSVIIKQQSKLRLRARKLDVVRVEQLLENLLAALN